MSYKMSDGEYLYTLIITAKPSRAVSPSAGPRVNTVVSLERCLYSVQGTMDVKARIQFRHYACYQRGAKKHLQSVWKQMSKSNVEPTLSQNTQEFKYVKLHRVGFF